MSKKPRRVRTLVFTFPAIAFCAACHRGPLLKFGREYLWRYGADKNAPLVCSDDCAKTAAERAAAEAPIAVTPPAPIARQMAEFIITRVAAEQACTRRQLNAAGFTWDQIREHGPAAIALAGTLAPSLRGEGNP
jgi:hypothetical protein